MIKVQRCFSAIRKHYHQLTGQKTIQLGRRKKVFVPCWWLYLPRIETENTPHVKVPEFTRERGWPQIIIPDPQNQIYL